MFRLFEEVDPDFEQQCYYTFAAFIAWFCLCTFIFYTYTTKPPNEWTVEKPRLEHMSGLRAMAAIQVVATHFILPGYSLEKNDEYHLENPIYYNAVHRAGDSSVTMVILVSGFFTHYAYSHELKTGGNVVFWARRILRVIPVYYLAHFSSCWVTAGTMDACQAKNTWGVMFFMSTWWYEYSWTTPNRMLWTICSLAWSWLLFPFMARALNYIRARMAPETYSLKMWFTGVLICSLMAHSVAIYLGATITVIPYIHMKACPIMVFLQFLCGVFTAEALLYLPKDSRLLDNYVFPIIADLTFVVGVGLWWVLPWFVKAEAFRHPEGFFVNAYMSWWAVYIFASCHGKTGIVHRIATNRLLSTLGEYSMEIYCFQYPVFTFIKNWRQSPSQYERIEFQEWTFCLAVLIVVSVLYAEIIGFPYVKWLRSFCNYYGGVAPKRPVETITLNKKTEKKQKIEDRRPDRAEIDALEPLIGV